MMLILELITLMIIVVVCGAILMASWEKQKIKHYYKQLNREYNDDDSRDNE